MVKRAMLAVTIALLAPTVSAERFGAVDIVTLPGLGGTAAGGDYAEYRFQIRNREGTPHLVQLALVTTEWRGVEQRTLRRIVVAPRSFSEVRIHQPTHQHDAGTELVLSVDGEEHRDRLRLRSGYEPRQAQTLLSRSFPDVNFRAPAGSSAPPSRRFNPYAPAAPAPPPGLMHHPIRAALSPALWSTSWLGYTRYDAVLITDSDWNELPPAARLAILGYVRAGGNLVVSGAVIPGIEFDRSVGPFRVASLAFGSVYHHSDLSQKIDAAEMIDASRRWNRFALENNRAPVEEFRLLPASPVPTGALFSTLVLFAVVAGPVSLTVAARRNRRLAIFWIVPALAIVTSAAIIGVSLSAEGWQRLSRSSSITFLDETSGNATTLGVIGIYATVPPDGQVRFSRETEIRAFTEALAANADLDVTEGQRLLSGWVRSRVSTYFTTRKNERRRERLVLRGDSGGMTVTNGLGVPIRKLFIADESGVVYTAANVAAGAQTRLAPTALRVQDAARVYEVGPPSLWPSYASRVESTPESALRRGSYVAILDNSPFAERALEKPRTSTAEGVVIGVMRKRQL